MNASTQSPVTGPGAAERPRRTAAAGGGAPVPVDLKADCIADSAGGLTFDLNVPQGTGTTWSAALVLRLRAGADDTGAAEGTDDEVRLPLGPNGPGRLRAVLPSTVALAEGRWHAFADLGDGVDPRRLLPGVNDLRSLVDRRPLAGIGRLGVRIPYATKLGNLALRSWLRGPHAEAGDILVAPEGLTVTGRLYGASPTAGAHAEARARRAGLDPVAVPLTVDGPDFRFTLPFEELAARWRHGSEPWDLWLCPAAEVPPVRIARLLDDVPEKKQVFSYPALSVPAEDRELRIGPYYTLDNDLAVRVSGPAGEA